MNEIARLVVDLANQKLENLMLKGLLTIAGAFLIKEEIKFRVKKKSDSK